jgi:hypothetical protein
MRGTRKFAASVGGSLIALLLGLGFVISCGLLAVHIWTAPRVDLQIVGEFLLVAVLALEGIVAVRHLQQSKLDSLHVLFDVLQEYQSAEMTLALIALWRFRRDHGDRFIEAYLETWHHDDEEIAKKPAEEQVEAMRATLHYRRRMVKEFFNLLAGLYELGVLPREVVYTYWNETELRIVPEILIPLETAVARELRTEKDLGAWFQRLRRLYEDNTAHTAG